MTTEKKSAQLFFDWKAEPSEIAGAFKEALGRLGFFVYDHPAAEGSDQYGLIISNAAQELLEEDVDYTTGG